MSNAKSHSEVFFWALERDSFSAPALKLWRGLYKPLSDSAYNIM